MELIDINTRMKVMQGGMRCGKSCINEILREVSKTNPSIKVDSLNDCDIVGKKSNSKDRVWIEEATHIDDSVMKSIIDKRNL